MRQPIKTADYVPYRDRVVKLLSAVQGGMLVKDMYACLGGKRMSLEAALSSLVLEGAIVRVYQGFYAKALPPGEPVDKSAPLPSTYQSSIRPLTVRELMRGRA